MTSNSLTKNEEHDIPSQILKTIFGLHASVIAHQARSSITPQVKIKNWRKGKLCGNGGIHLQNIATPAFPREQVSWHHGYQPICPGKPMEQHRRDVFKFLMSDRCFGPTGAPTSTSLETWRRQTTIRTAAHEALPALYENKDVTLRLSNSKGGWVGNSMLALRRQLSDWSFAFGPLPVTQSSAPARDPIPLTPDACVLAQLNIFGLKNIYIF